VIIVRRTLAIARVELIRLLRARVALTMLLLVPAMQVVLFGYAIRPGPATVTVAISGPSRVLVDRGAAVLGAEPGVAIGRTSATPGDAEQAVRNGDAAIGIDLPSPFAAQGAVRVFVDATEPALVDGATQAVRAAYWRAEAEQADATAMPPEIVRLFNPEARADWSFLPALVGVTVMIAMVMLGALSVARERETGTWESGHALPLGPGVRLVGRTLPYAVIGSIQGILVLAAGHALFDLPVGRGWTAICLLLPWFAAAHVVLGQAIAARAAGQLEALQGVIAFYLPAMLLSGFLYPFASLPHWARAIGSVFPLTHFIRAARGAVLRRESWAIVLAHGVPILGFLVLAGMVALIGAKRKLD